VNARMSTLHHSAATHMGLGEIVFAGFVVLVLFGFALVIAK
jgi:hypothetical protein